MRITLLFSFCALIFSSVGLCQTTHDIEAGGGPNGPTPYYSPQFITIQVGDIVRWTNSGGTHNVDGTLETFPGNPEGFTTGIPSSSLWEFEHTFNIPGFYEFECAAFDHADTQFGTITVVADGVGINELERISIEFYPNPVSEQLTVSSAKRITGLSIMTLEMKQVALFEVTGSEMTESIYIGELKKGTYLLEVASGSTKSYKRLMKK